MISRNDPRIRRAIDQITSNLEAANERTQESIFNFTQAYIKPCCSSLGGCTRSCAFPCCPNDEDRRRRHRQRARGQAESSFDFYEDWEANETDALLGIAGVEGTHSPGPSTRQPLRRRQMSYGTNKVGIESDTKNIHSSSYFGFLERVPFRLGAKGFTYKPSIADLQDHPGSRKQDTPEEQPLLDDIDSEIAEPSQRTHKRNRSGTQSSGISGMSGHTTDSFSSRGDIFPSDDEMDDAVPIDDELALHLERRITDHTDGSFGSLSRDSRRMSSSTHSLPASAKKSSKRPSVKSHSSSSQDVRQITPAIQETAVSATANRVELPINDIQTLDAPEPIEHLEEPESAESVQHLDVPESTPLAEESQAHMEHSSTTDIFNAATLPRFS
jgi:hypothetical protein